MSHLHRGHPSEAERWLIEYLDRDPDSVSGHLNLFKVELALDRPEEAWEHLLTAVRLNPSHAGAINQMVRFLIDVDRKDEAVSRLREIAKTHTESAAAVKALARLFEESGEGDEEHQAWEEAYRRAPDDPEVLVGYTASLGQRGKPEEVVKLLSPKAEKLPFELTVNLVVALGRLDRREEARRILKTFRSRPNLGHQDKERADDLLKEWDRQSGDKK